MPLPFDPDHEPRRRRFPQGQSPAGVGLFGGAGCAQGLSATAQGLQRDAVGASQISQEDAAGHRLDHGGRGAPVGQ